MSWVIAKPDHHRDRECAHVIQNIMQMVMQLHHRK